MTQPIVSDPKFCVFFHEMVTGCYGLISEVKSNLRPNGRYNLLRSCDVPHTLLGTGHIAVNKTDRSSLSEYTFYGGGQIGVQINKMIRDYNYNQCYEGNKQR